MNIDEYYKNLTTELFSLKDRVRHYIDDAHWLSVGEWKESALRAILRRHLPNNIGVGRGFIVNKEGPSTQIDILLYNTLMPILFQDGDFVIVTADTALGAIEVKTKINSLISFKKELINLSKNAIMTTSRPYNPNRFFGLFAYEEPWFKKEKPNVLQTLQNIVNGKHNNIISCISLGPDYFVRYWESSPDKKSPRLSNYKKWHSYNLKNKAPAYFIHNVIGRLCSQWENNNVDIWYPEDGQENHKLSEIDLFFPKK